MKKLENLVKFIDEMSDIFLSKLFFRSFYKIRSPIFVGLLTNNFILLTTE